MSTTTNQPKLPDRAEGRLGFIADLSFVLCTTWLVLWRIEMPSAPAGSIWASWWPALVVAVLVVAASIVGAMQRSPRGFLPYTLRWALLGAVLVLPAWLAFSLIDVQGRAPTARGAATQLREEARDMLANTNDAAEKAELQQVIEHADAAEKFADVLDRARERGVEVPHADLASRPEFAEMDPSALPPATRETLESAIGIAEAMENGQGLPEDLSAIAQESGLSDAQMTGALIALLAVAIAPILGLSAPLVESLLGALIANGSFSLSGLLHVGAALAMSTTPSGKLSESKVRANFERLSDGAAKGARFMEALEAKGGAKVQDSEAFQTLKNALNDVAGSPLNLPGPKACLERIPDHEHLSVAQRKRQLKRECPHLRPQDISDVADDGKVTR